MIPKNYIAHAFITLKVMQRICQPLATSIIIFSNFIISHREFRTT